MIPRVVERLFGRNAPVASAATTCRTVAAEPRIGAPRPPGALIHRDEILDDRMRISGYRFRPVSLDSDMPPSPQAKIHALEIDNLASFVQRRLAVVPLKVDEWSSEGFRPFITPNTIFEVEVPAPGGDMVSWRERLNDIKASGAKIGLDSIVASSRMSDVLALADAIFIKPGDYSIDGLDRMIAGLRGHDPKLAIVVDGVHTWPDFRACLGMGAHYFMGSFATTTDIEDKADQPFAKSHRPAGTAQYVAQRCRTVRIGIAGQAGPLCGHEDS